MTIIKLFTNSKNVRYSDKRTIPMISVERNEANYSNTLIFFLCNKKGIKYFKLLAQLSKRIYESKVRISVVRSCFREFFDADCL